MCLEKWRIDSTPMSNSTHWNRLLWLIFSVVLHIHWHNNRRVMNMYTVGVCCAMSCASEMTIQGKLKVLSWKYQQARSWSDLRCRNRHRKPSNAQKNNKSNNRAVWVKKAVKASENHNFPLSIMLFIECPNNMQRFKNRLYSRWFEGHIQVDQAQGFYEIVFTVITLHHTFNSFFVEYPNSIAKTVLMY